MHPSKKQIESGFLAALGICVLTAAAVHSQEDTEQLKSQENWLRYSNWEHRATIKVKPPSSKSDSVGAAADEKKLPLPDHPGSKTVEGGQFTVPGWAFQSTQATQRPAEIILGAESFGSSSNRLGLAAFGGYTYPPFFGGSSWRYNGAAGWGRSWGPGFGCWGSGYGAIGPGFGAWGPGFGSMGSGFGSWGSSWSHGHGFGLGWGGLAGPAFGVPFAGMGSGFRQSRLGPTVIQTGPSPASGNYYQPSTGDSSASGNYYASGTPWQVPVNGPSNPKDYWGPEGNPFK